MEARVLELVTSFNPSQVQACLANRLTGVSTDLVGNWDKSQQLLALWGTSTDSIAGIAPANEATGVYLTIAGMVRKVAWIEGSAESIPKTSFGKDETEQAGQYTYLVKCR